VGTERLISSASQRLPCISQPVANQLRLMAGLAGLLITLIFRRLDLLAPLVSLPGSPSALRTPLSRNRLSHSSPEVTLEILSRDNCNRLLPGTESVSRRVYRWLLMSSFHTVASQPADAHARKPPFRGSSRV